MSDWLAIDSAPREGTQILLYYPAYRKGHRVKLGYWIDSARLEYGKIVHQTQEWSPEVGSLMPMTRDKASPSHWMELPADPFIADLQKTA